MPAERMKFGKKQERIMREIAHDQAEADREMERLDWPSWVWNVDEDVPVPRGYKIDLGDATPDEISRAYADLDEAQIGTLRIVSGRGIGWYDVYAP